MEIREDGQVAVRRGNTKVFKHRCHGFETPLPALPNREILSDHVIFVLNKV